MEHELRLRILSKLEACHSTQALLQYIEREMLGLPIFPIPDDDGENIYQSDIYTQPTTPECDDY